MQVLLKYLQKLSLGQKKNPSLPKSKLTNLGCSTDRYLGFLFSTRASNKTKKKRVVKNRSLQKERKNAAQEEKKKNKREELGEKKRRKGELILPFNEMTRRSSAIKKFGSSHFFSCLIFLMSVF